MNARRTILLVAAIAVPLLLIYAASDSDQPGDPSRPCDHTVTIDSVVYDVPERWCGRYVPPEDRAKGDTLARLPYELCYDSSRIYVTRATRDAFVNMADAARAAGINLMVDSGFRSPGFQKRIIKRRMAAGETFDQAVRFVAPPGFSQHHTGRAVDLVPSEARFAHTDAYEWLKEHAAEYGFVETYPEPEDPSDYVYWESWHWFFEGK